MGSIADILLTITQALQLVALAPTIFVIAFLVCSSKRDGSNIVPILYFLALGCNFIIPLLDVIVNPDDNLSLRGSLMLGASLSTAFSYLLIIQFLHGLMPGLRYWAVLALPAIGGSPFIYASLYLQEICFANEWCFKISDLSILYGIFSGALIFLLVMFEFARSTSRIAIEDVDRQHKYWLIMALVNLNLVLLIIDLMTLAGHFRPQDALFAMTILRIAFIYLVLTSIFRVFYDIFDLKILLSASSKQRINPETDTRAVALIREWMETEALYREMDLTRQELAKRLKLSEHHVARIANTYFGKNFNELVNSYRIREAKERLLAEPDTAITTLAFEVGFNSIASFNRVFKEMVGASPTDFRAFQKNRVL